ncbi:MAG: phosphate transport system protein [Neolewinella sp.]
MSSHYEERLQRDLDWISELVGRVGIQLVETIHDAVAAVLSLNKQAAAELVIGDYTINRQTRELDRLCHAFVARHLPSAGHLRYVSSVLRLNIALERIGDYAATIARTAAQLSETPPAAVGRDIEMMAEQSRRTLSDALKSFQDRDASLAQATKSAATQFAPYFDRVFNDLVKEGEAKTRPMKDLFALMATLNRLERVIHQAKNVCEETVFVVTGQAKGEKSFQILYVDDANSGASQIAEHFTTKAFPNSGRYMSAGWNAADNAVDNTASEYLSFAETVGLDLSTAWPTDINTMKEQLDQFDLVIALGKGSRANLPKLPFHTASLEWDINTTDTPEAVYRQLTPMVRELMEQLRGEHAS